MFLIYALKNNDLIDIDNYNSLTLNNKKLSGITRLWKEFIRIKGIKQFTDFTIRNIFDVRNKIIYGHGILSINQGIYDEAYSNIRKIYSDHDVILDKKEYNTIDLIELSKPIVLYGYDTHICNYICKKFHLKY